MDTLDVSLVARGVSIAKGVMFLEIVAFCSIQANQLGSSSLFAATLRALFTGQPVGTNNAIIFAFMTPVPAAQPSNSSVFRRLSPKRRSSLPNRSGRLVRTLLWTLFGFVSFVLIAGILIWFLAPPILRDFINKKGTELPDYTFHIEAISINPWAATINVDGGQLIKQHNEIPVPFFTSPRVHVALQWREILHGDLRSNIEIITPTINFVQGPTAETTQLSLDPVWVQEVKHLVPLRINRFEVLQGAVHYFDFHAEPKINMAITNLHVVLDNLTNAANVKSEFPSTVLVTANPLERGRLIAHLAVNVDNKSPTFEEQIRLENIPIPAINSLLSKYAKVYAKSGNFSLYTEMVSHHGKFNGYAKPFLNDLVFEPMPKDQNGIAALWASLANGVKDVFQDSKKTIATEVPIKGTYQDPDVSFWDAGFGALRNAYFESLKAGFQTPELAPAPDKAADQKIHEIIRSDANLNPPDPTTNPPH